MKRKSLMLMTCLLCALLTTTIVVFSSQIGSYTLTVTTEPLGCFWYLSNGNFTFKLGSGASAQLDSGTYNLSVPSNVTIQYADYPNEVWVFSSWSDGVVAPSRAVNLTADLALTAHYVEQQSPPLPKYYVVSIDSKTHEDYGLTYPATYMFNISNTMNLTAYKRYGTAEAWVKVPERFSGEFFNGVEAARFNYTEGKAYISIAFASYSDYIYIKIMDGEKEALTSFLGISEYYDNRKCAVTITIDDAQDWPPYGGLDAFLNDSQAFSDAQVWWTAGFITYDCHGWGTYQAGINMGYLEAASHSYTHPGSASDYNIKGYDAEIGGSKQTIINNLDLPYKKGDKEYVLAWIEPQGYSDENVSQKLGEFKYLVSRSAVNTYAPTTWAEWDSVNMHYSRASASTSMDWDSIDILNAVFDETYKSGGIYLTRGHVGTLAWGPNQRAYRHIQYIKGHADIWYVGFGLMYAYHHVQRTATVVSVS
jgi:hypothetical protein